MCISANFIHQLVCIISVCTIVLLCVCVCLRVIIQLLNSTFDYLSIKDILSVKGHFLNLIDPASRPIARKGDFFFELKLMLAHSHVTMFVRTV